MYRDVTEDCEAIRLACPIRKMTREDRRSHVEMCMHLALGFAETDPTVPRWRVACTIHRLLAMELAEIIVFPDGLVGIRVIPGLRIEKVAVH